MFKPFTPPSSTRRALQCAMSVMVCLSSQAFAQPSNKPLLTVQQGAKPNLMIAIDNSGSMAFPYHETYAIPNATAIINQRQCPAPNYSNSSSGDLAKFNAGLNGPAVYSHSANTYTCFQRVQISGLWQTQALTNVSVAYSPNASISNWDAMRSYVFNTVYYDPRVRYLPRVDGSGNPVTPTDNVVFVSNQGENGFQYGVYEQTTNTSNYRVYSSFYASDNVTRNFYGDINTLNPAGYNPSYYFLNYSSTIQVPIHIGHTSANGATPAFSYAYCPDPITSAPPACKSLTRVNVRFGVNQNYTIPSPHNRTDCSGSTCSSAQEIANILNWYRWYSNRQIAVSTAIGLALADIGPDGTRNIPSQFDNQLRMGYTSINNPSTRYGDNPLTTPPGAGLSSTVSRGVRPLLRGSTSNTELFNWLGRLRPHGGTPLHYAVNQVADYYLMNGGVGENPWRTDPQSSSSPEMSCRRSFNLLFSDGSWTGGSYAPPAGPNYDNQTGPTFSRTLADGTTESFSYQPQGVSDRTKYIPFPSSGTGGLADLTARYFWHTDFRTSLPNGIKPRPGQPTFWQNMSTYTVGYLISPTGEATGTGLTFDQIEAYKASYASLGYSAANPKPAWATGDLLSDGTTPATLAGSLKRVDDFVQAGYTGGARSFSARSADDVKRIFVTIVKEILNSSGNDAGVAVSGGASDANTLEGALKYKVSYDTGDNSGDIKAFELDAKGFEKPGIKWSAEQLIPAPGGRRLFTMSGMNNPIAFNGNFSSLPTDVRNALAQGPDAARIPSDARFVNYLRGDNAATDTAGMLFRQRASKIAAMVNPPSVLMNGAEDYAYDENSGKNADSNVDGSGSYEPFYGRKVGYPASLFVATNAGMMHSLDAKLGTEQSAFMPRRSLKRMLAFAKEPYSFEYVLDGPISQNDVFDRPYADQNQFAPADQWKAWRHLGVGTGGRGEPLMYAINAPFNPGANPNRAPGQQDFLWETGPDLVNSADGGDVSMGYISNVPRAGQTEDMTNPGSLTAKRGKWIVAVNNGHYNGEADGGKAGLVVLDALTGEVIRTIALPAGYDAGRGLSGVTMVRNFRDNKRVVAAYAGDAKGQLWRFNLTGPVSTWHVQHNAPIFKVPQDGGKDRPIFGHPAWQPHPTKKGNIVVFATGIMLEDGDLDDLNAQSIYGIWDRTNADGTTLNGEPFQQVQDANLVEQNIIPTTAKQKFGNTYYGITDRKLDWSKDRGWRMPLVNVAQNGLEGERSIANVLNFGPSVVVTTAVLRRASSNEEMCSVTDVIGNYLYLLNAGTAAQSKSKSFDIEGANGSTTPDGRLDPYAVAYLPRGGFTRGVSIARVYTKADGSPLTPKTPPVAANPNDPYVDTTELRKSGGVGAGARGEPEEGCSSGGGGSTGSGVILGTGSEPISAGFACPSSGWSRTQYQLSKPPSKDAPK